MNGGLEMAQQAVNNVWDERELEDDPRFSKVFICSHGRCRVYYSEINGIQVNVQNDVGRVEQVIIIDKYAIVSDNFFVDIANNRKIGFPYDLFESYVNLAQFLPWHVKRKFNGFFGINYMPSSSLFNKGRRTE